MKLINGIKYYFFVEGMEYADLEDAEEAVENIVGSDYNNVDYRGDFPDEFFNDCIAYIDIVDEAGESISYEDFAAMYYWGNIMISLTETNGLDHGSFENVDLAFEKIKDLLVQRGITNYYIILVDVQDGVVRVDYGSYTNFFYLEDPENKNLYSNMIYTLNTGSRTAQMSNHEVDSNQAILDKMEDCAEEEKEEKSVLDEYTLDDYFKDHDDTAPYLELANTEKEKSKPATFSIIGIQNVAKFIEALTDKNGHNEFRIWTDAYQAHLDPAERSYEVEVADTRNGERFIFDSEEDW